MSTPPPVLSDPYPEDDSDRELLASLPDDPQLLDWPSAAWNKHLDVCGQPRRCPHFQHVPLPDWWWARMRSGTPLHADPAKAVEIAMLRINKFRGGKHVSREGAAFARDAARDALFAAPQPVSIEWVAQTLACVGGLATWVHNEGEPLTRGHVLDENTRFRYLEGPTGATTLSKHSRRNYRLRFDKLAVSLLGSQREIYAGQKPLSPPEALLPLTRQQEADLWVWSQGLRPPMLRQRIQGVIVTSLGVGARRRDFIILRSADVARDKHGVHVSMPESTSTGRAVVPARVVTCSAQWEDRLWTLAQTMAPEGHLAAPWRTTPPEKTSVDGTMRNAQTNQASPPPVHFSSESLRNTWLVRHLEAGTPIPLLMQQGGLLTTHSIEKLVPFAAPVPAQKAAAWMRCTNAPTTTSPAAEGPQGAHGAQQGDEA